MARHVWTGLDGLRGVAVLGVVLFHASVGWGVNGYVGVDVFFCLSGFLITWLLLEERSRRGRVDVRAFYLRRVLRLFPALVALCVGVLALGVLVGDLRRIVGGALAGLLYAANWWLYTGHDAPLLEHLWTLSIEEHFYLVWPALLILLTAGSRRKVAVGVGCIALLVALLGLPWPHDIAAVRLSYLRGAPIVWGCALAGVLHRWRPSASLRRGLSATALPCLAALLVALVLPARLPADMTMGLRSVPGALTVVVVAAVVTDQWSPVSRGLSWRPLRRIGRRSYGIYLYHLPIISVLLHHAPLPFGDVVRGLTGAALSVAVAAASYRWLEQPFLRVKERRAAPVGSMD